MFRRSVIRTPHERWPGHGLGAFPALDGLRGLAALLVALSHVPPTTGLNPPPFPLVDLFFVISGFLLAYRWDARLIAGGSRRDFVVARVQRLMPLFLLSTAAMLILHLAMGTELDWAAVGWNLLLLPKPFAEPAAYAFVLNMVFWSLSVEFLANLGYALLGRHLTNRVLGAAVVAGVGLLVYTSSQNPYGVNGGWSHFNLGVGYARGLFAFAAGVALARLYRAGLLNRLPALPTGAVLLAVCAMSAVPFLGSYPAQLALMLLVPPALTALGARAVAGAKDAPVYVWLREVSYAVYLLHLPVLFLVVGAGQALAGRTGALLAVPVSFVLFTGAAHFLHHRFERPVARMLRSRRTAPAAPIMLPA